MPVRARLTEALVLTSSANWLVQVPASYISYHAIPLILGLPLFCRCTRL